LNEDHDFGRVTEKLKEYRDVVAEEKMEVVEVC
jgi:hypothetical protein